MYNKAMPGHNSRSFSIAFNKYCHFMNKSEEQMKSHISYVVVIIQQLKRL